MQLSVTAEAMRGTRATEWVVLDWIRLRRELGECRRESGLEVADLADKLKIAKSTLYRIENVDRLPDHKVEMETIAAWLEATGQTLASFFVRLDPSGMLDATKTVIVKKSLQPSSPRQGSADTTSASGPSPRSESRGAQHSAVRSIDDALLSEIRRDVFDTIAHAFVQAAIRESHRQAPAPHARKGRGRRRGGKADR